MSDFDKEAEREKLREKYERDRDDRESTERMSDLLLKGATMTNAHCGTCGDPIFRYEGEEFCPTCQEVVAEADEPTEGEDPTDEATPAEREGAADAATDGPADAETDGTAGAEANAAADPSNATADAPTDTPGERSGEADTGTPRPRANGRTDAPTDTPEGTAGRTADAATGQPTTDAATGQPTADDNSPSDWTTSIDPSVADAVETGGKSANTTQTTAPDREATGAKSGRSGGLADARASLETTVTRLTAQAEASDDLERTRAYLAAVEEAADALAAVRRADR